MPASPQLSDGSDKARRASSRPPLRRRLGDSLTRVRRQFDSLRRRFSSSCSNRSRGGRVSLHRPRLAESASSGSLSGFTKTTPTSAVSKADRGGGGDGVARSNGNNMHDSLEVEVSWSGRVFAPKTCLLGAAAERNRSNMYQNRKSVLPQTMTMVMMPTFSRGSVSEFDSRCTAYMPANALSNLTPLRRVCLPAPVVSCSRCRQQQEVPEHQQQLHQVRAPGRVLKANNGGSTSEIIEVAVFAETTSEEVITGLRVDLFEMDRNAEENLEVGLGMMEQQTSSEGPLLQEPEPESPPPSLPPPLPPTPLPSPEKLTSMSKTDAAGDSAGGGGCCCCGKSSKVKRVSEKSEVQAARASQSSLSGSEGLLADDFDDLRHPLPPLVEEEPTATAATNATPTIEAADSESNVRFVGETPRPPTSTSSSIEAASSGSTENSDTEVAVGVDSGDAAAPVRGVETLKWRPPQPPTSTSNPHSPPQQPQLLTCRHAVSLLAQTKQQQQLLDSSRTNSESSEPLMNAGVSCNSKSNSSSSSSWLTQELEISVPIKQDRRKTPHQCSLTFVSTDSSDSDITLTSDEARPNSALSASADSWSVEEVQVGGGNNSVNLSTVSMQEVHAPKPQLQVLRQLQSRSVVMPATGANCSYSTNTLPSEGTAERIERSSLKPQRHRRLPQLQEQRWTSSSSSSDSESIIKAAKAQHSTVRHRCEHQQDGRCLTILAPPGAITDAALRKFDLETAMRSCSLCPVGSLPPLINNAAATPASRSRSRDRQSFTVERDSDSFSSRRDSSIIFQLASRILDDSELPDGSECFGEEDDTGVRGRPLLMVSDDKSSWCARQQTLCLIQTPPLVMQARNVQCVPGDRLHRLPRSQPPRIHQYQLPEPAPPPALTSQSVWHGSEHQLVDAAIVSFSSRYCGGQPTDWPIFAAVAAYRIACDGVGLPAFDWQARGGVQQVFMAPTMLHRDDTGRLATSAAAAEATAIISGGVSGGSSDLRHGPLEPQLLLSCDFIAGLLEPEMSTKLSLAADSASHSQAGHRNNWNASNNASDRNLSRCHRLLTRLLRRSNSLSSSSSSSASSLPSSSPRPVVELARHNVVELAALPCRSYCQAALHISLVIFDSDAGSDGTVIDELIIGAVGENRNNSNSSSSAGKVEDGQTGRHKTYFARRCIARQEESAAIVIQEAASRPAEATSVATVRPRRRAAVRLALARSELLWPPPLPRDCIRMLSLLDDTVASFVWWSLLPLRSVRSRTVASSERSEQVRRSSSRQR